MHSRGKKLVNLALLEGNKQVDNNATPKGSSEVQMNDDFNDFGSDDSVADKDYVPSATSSSESELDVGGKSDSESDILNAENSDTEVENTQGVNEATVHVVMTLAAGNFEYFLWRVVSKVNGNTDALDSTNDFNNLISESCDTLKQVPICSSENRNLSGKENIDDENGTDQQHPAFQYRKITYKNIVQQADQKIESIGIGDNVLMENVRTFTNRDNFSTLTEIDKVIATQSDPQYEQFLADVWVGIILTLIVISCVCCMCSCLLYHKFQQWKRQILQARHNANVEIGNAESESLPSYTIVSGLPSYEEALEQLQKVKQLAKIDKRENADVWIPHTPPTPTTTSGLSVSDLLQIYQNPSLPVKS
ncbi:hypothetical protein FQA39_LY06750 [Lamprigera yunnana]|nr:hypothetical protein FQA39_LY06750 [Lamprigera yunnana]